jgi:type VI secretion system (T6SS) spike protein VgrG3
MFPQRLLRIGICAIAVSLFQTTAAVTAPKSNAADSPRRWKIEYLRNGNWAGSAVFDTQQQAQAKLDSQRKSKRSSRSGLVVARVVPTDWKRWETLGALSAKYEAGGRKTGTVSTGKGDAGGVSYGSYQLSSKVGTAQRFVDQYYADWFGSAKPGSDEFSALWKQLAAEREPELAAYEHLFIADTHYQPFANRLSNEIGLNLEERSHTLRDVAWSTAVQHGAGNKIFQRALEKPVQENRLKQLTDREIIELVYEERGRVDSNGVSVYFSRSSPEVQKSVRNRFKNEMQDALKDLASEPRGKSRR